MTTKTTNSSKMKGNHLKGRMRTVRGFKPARGGKLPLSMITLRDTHSISGLDEALEELDIS